MKKIKGDNMKQPTQEKEIYASFNIKQLKEMIKEIKEDKINHIVYGQKIPSQASKRFIFKQEKHDKNSFWRGGDLIRIRNKE